MGSRRVDLESLGADLFELDGDPSDGVIALPCALTALQASTTALHIGCEDGRWAVYALGEAPHGGVHLASSGSEEGTVLAFELEGAELEPVVGQQQRWIGPHQFSIGAGGSKLTRRSLRAGSGVTPIPCATSALASEARGGAARIWVGCSSGEVYAFDVRRDGGLVASSVDQQRGPVATFPDLGAALWIEAPVRSPALRPGPSKEEKAEREARRYANAILRARRDVEEAKAVGRGLIIGGSVLLALSYGGLALGGAFTGNGFNLVPVVGPFIGAGTGYSIAPGVAIGFGVVENVGLGLLITGLAKRKRARDRLYDRVRVGRLPLRRGGGVRVSLRF